MVTPLGQGGGNSSLCLSMFRKSREAGKIDYAIVVSHPFSIMTSIQYTFLSSQEPRTFPSDLGTNRTFLSINFHVA